jgi:DNA-binding NtrC family response regulator
MKNEFDGLVDRLLAANITLQDSVEILERSMIAAALARYRGNQSAASKHLGIHRNTLQRKLREYEINRKPVAREARRRRTGTD